MASDKFTGDADEAAVWAGAFGGKKPAEKPLTPDEKQQLNVLLLHAHEVGDADGLAELTKLAADPEAFRRAAASFGAAGKSGAADSDNGGAIVTPSRTKALDPRAALAAWKRGKGLT